ncbi:hypothetical protein GCM10011519_22510 [Marmoricola endophyticus]|uniref:Uncharacterized protein n=1 Tax=Marmoricola endophyticus TaxID=2040280 RepID=A0A917BJM1_9ACTN|nr:hypothetical protein [Marmoricola endophyticus]GGF48011.1 hypothetical protein GCM10011519_22510 [Marmoricola endophyticus]
MTFTLDEPVRVTRRLQYAGVAVLVVVVALGVLVWRATRPNLDPDTAARTVAGTTVLVYTEEWGGDYSTVGGTGRLEVLEGGCLGLSDGSLFVFPYGAKAFERDGEVAVAIGTKVVRPGDVVGIGGGRPVPIEDFGGNLAEHVPPGCGAREATSGIEMYFPTGGS